MTLQILPFPICYLQGRGGVNRARPGMGATPVPAAGWPGPASAGNLAVPATGMKGNRNVALVVVDHGSRSDASNSSLDDVVGEIARRAEGRYVAVLPAHMELAAPTIADAFEAAVAAGASLVVVALYFLAPGRHSELDVPRLAAEAGARFGVGHVVTRSLGPDAALVELVLSRAADAER